MELFWFWLMKPLAEMAVGLVVVAFVALIFGLAALPRWIKQVRCQHLEVFETGSCDAVCRRCGKNLGFIQKWRDAQKART